MRLVKSLRGALPRRYVLPVLAMLCVAAFAWPALASGTEGVQGASPSPSHLPGAPSLVWSPASLERDWPGPLRPEPTEGAPMVEMERRVEEDLTDEDGDVIARTYLYVYADPSGDVTGTAYAWLDLTEVGLSTNSAGHLKNVRFALAGSPAGPGDPSASWIAYGLVLDTDADAAPDVRLGMDNLPDGTHRAWWTDLATGDTLAKAGPPYGMGPVTVDTWYPGEEFTPDGGWFMGGVAAAQRLYVWAAAIEGGQIVASDHAPDVGWLELPVEEG